MAFIPLKSLLPKSVQKTGRETELKTGDIEALYRRAVVAVINKKAAQNSRALSIKHKVLTVAVPSSAWACQLHFAHNEVVKQINQIVDRKLVERVIFRVR